MPLCGNRFRHSDVLIAITPGGEVEIRSARPPGSVAPARLAAVGIGLECLRPPRDSAPGPHGRRSSIRHSDGLAGGALRAGAAEIAEVCSRTTRPECDERKY